MIFSQEFKRKFGKMIAWAIVLTILTGLLIAFYPLLVDPQMSTLVANLTSSLDESTRNIIGFFDGFEITDASHYLSLVYHYIAVLIFIFAIQIGANSLSYEQSSGNIEYIYSNPISKSEITTGKLAANVVIYIIFLIILALATFGIFVAINSFGLSGTDIEPLRTYEIVEAIIKIFTGLLGSGLVFMSLGFLYSSSTKNSIHADAISTLFIFLLMLVVIIGKVVGGALLNVINFFPSEVFEPFKFITANIDIISLIVNIVLFIVFIVLTYTIYSAKELRY